MFIDIAIKVIYFNIIRHYALGVDLMFIENIVFIKLLLNYYLLIFYYYNGVNIFILYYIIIVVRSSQYHLTLESNI